jgi:hypothetical protein
MNILAPCSLTTVQLNNVLSLTGRKKIEEAMFLHLTMDLRQKVDHYTFHRNLRTSNLFGNSSKKISTQVRDFILQFYGIKCTTEFIEKVGNIVGHHQPKETEVHYDILKECSWNAGDFGDHQSCFWGSSYWDIHFSNGGLAMRFFNPKAPTKGLGRCLISPLKYDGHDFYAVFNSYGFSLPTTAEIVNTIVGPKFMRWAYFTISGKKGTMYVNRMNAQGDSSSGFGAILTDHLSKGFLALPDVIDTEKMTRLTFRYSSITCPVCGEEVDTGELKAKGKFKGCVKCVKKCECGHSVYPQEEHHCIIEKLKPLSCTMFDIDGIFFPMQRVVDNGFLKRMRQYRVGAHIPDALATGGIMQGFDGSFGGGHLYGVSFQVNNAVVGFFAPLISNMPGVDINRVIHNTEHQAEYLGQTFAQAPEKFLNTVKQQGITFDKGVGSWVES